MSTRSVGSSSSSLKAPPLFPPITTTYSGSKAIALSSGAAAAATKTEQPSDPAPAQAVAALLSSLSLPPLASSPASQPASSTSASSSSSSSAASSSPSLFSGYLLSILHSTLSELSSALCLTGAALDDAELSCRPELVIALKDHFQLESQYGLLCNAMRQLSAEDEAFMQQQQLVHDQYSCLMDSTRSLLRLLPLPAADALQSPFYLLFSHLVALVTARLHLSAKDASKQQQLLSTLTSQQAADAASIASLSQQLAAARQRQSVALSQQEALLRKYQSQLSSLLDGAEEEALTFSRRMKEEEEESERLFEQRQAELETELQRLRDVELQEAQREEWRLEAGMRRKLSLRDDEVQAVIARYDAELGFQHELYHDLSAVYQREREEATRLRLYFDRVKERKDREREEMEALRLRRDEELLRAREREEAVRLLAAVYDGWMRKHGPKEKKRTADKKKKTKLMWRPPPQGKDPVDAAAAAASPSQQEAAQPVPSS